MKSLIAIACTLLLLQACGGSSDNSSTPAPIAETRSFYMGFTPWLYEASTAAIDVTYGRLHSEGDIIKHHFMAGVPWQEAFEQAAYHPSVEAEITGRLANTSPSMTVFLALDSLNPMRETLADNWGSEPNQSRSGDWAARKFDSPEVITAYVTFALDLIDRFDPLYFEYGTEVSELILNDSVAFDEYLVFAEAVYSQIKAVHPELILITSVSLKSPDSTQMRQVQSAYAALLPYTDLVGVSIYPYVFFDHNDRGDPDNLPSNWLTQIQQIAPNKPLAISETGWIGEDLSIPEYQYSEMSDPAKQSRYAERLLTAADRMNMDFVIWWTVADFDTLWNNELNQDPLAKIWKDIGLYDGEQQPREALGNWQSWLAKSRQ